MPLKTLPLEEPTLNLTPMIDVIMTLIIFFMVATKFTEEERSIDLRLPTAKSSNSEAASALTPKVVNVQADGGIFLGAQSVSLEQLTLQLTQLRIQQPKIQVIVRGDQFTTHGRMAEVYHAVRQAGVPELGIAYTTSENLRK
ncbi:MAG: biopolymer transporter ExbD [Pirellulales bacterium]|nr:biopolymer transporter ExbD [Pirellulales bacterium]